MSDDRLILSLNAQSARVLGAIDALQACVAAPHPGNLDPLMHLRWNFTREMLLFFARTEKELLEPMSRDSRPGVAERAVRSSRDMAGVYGHFTRHVARWHAPPCPALWGPYRDAVTMLTRMVAACLASQQQKIYPLLPVQPGGWPRILTFAPINYAAEAWKIRALLPALDRHDAAAG